MHPKGNHWFADQLDEDDDRPGEWGVFLQIEGHIQRLGASFPDEASAVAFIRDEVIGAAAPREG